MENGAGHWYTLGMACIRNPALSIGLLLGLVLSAPAWCAEAGIGAITRPSEDVTLSFALPGTLAAVSVKDGQAVRKGDILIQLDDAAERVQLEQLAAQAGDDTRVQAAAAQAAQKREDYKKLESLGKDGAVTKWDVEHAKLDVVIADLSLRLAKFELGQSQRRKRELERQLERMRLVSPITGRVEKVFLMPGEAADKLQRVVRLVNVDPLWLNVPVPLARARRITLGQAARVRVAHDEFPVGEGRSPKVIYIAKVADAASDTLTVRVEVPNPKGRPAGEHVTVSFPPPVKRKQ